MMVCTCLLRNQGGRANSQNDFGSPLLREIGLPVHMRHVSTDLTNFFPGAAFESYLPLTLASKKGSSGSVLSRCFSFSSALLSDTREAGAAKGYSTKGSLRLLFICYWKKAMVMAAKALGEHNPTGCRPRLRRPQHLFPSFLLGRGLFNGVYYKIALLRSNRGGIHDRWMDGLAFFVL